MTSASDLVKIFKEDIDYFYTSDFELTSWLPFLEFRCLVFGIALYSIVMAVSSSRLKRKRDSIIRPNCHVLLANNIGQAALNMAMAFLATVTFAMTLYRDRRLCKQSRPVIILDTENFEYGIAQTWLEAHVMYIFYITRWFNLFETAVFVSMGKHQYNCFAIHFHHLVMFTFVWISTKYHPCGFALIQTQLSSPIHLLMNLYSTFNTFPQLRPYLKWKISIPVLQILTFVVGATTTGYCTAQKLHGKSSGGPLPFMLAYILYLILITMLFGKFYYKKYVSVKSD